MLLLDTNVLSAMMRVAPDPFVSALLARRPAETVFTATLCQAEILGGIAVLPPGRRRVALEAAASSMFAEDFAGRLLPFDEAAAIAYAELLGARQRDGRPVATMDLMIAAVARSRGATIATRNVADFTGYGITIIDPWHS